MKIYHKVQETGFQVQDLIIIQTNTLVKMHQHSHSEENQMKSYLLMFLVLGHMIYKKILDLKVQALE